MDSQNTPEDAVDGVDVVPSGAAFSSEAAPGPGAVADPREGAENRDAWAKLDHSALLYRISTLLESFAASYYPFLDDIAASRPPAEPSPEPPLPHDFLDTYQLCWFVCSSSNEDENQSSDWLLVKRALFRGGPVPRHAGPSKLRAELALTIFRAEYHILRRAAVILADSERNSSWTRALPASDVVRMAFAMSFAVCSIRAVDILFILASASKAVVKRLGDDTGLLISLMTVFGEVVKRSGDFGDRSPTGDEKHDFLPTITDLLVAILGQNAKTLGESLNGGRGTAIMESATTAFETFEKGSAALAGPFIGNGDIFRMCRNTVMIAVLTKGKEAAQAVAANMPVGSWLHENQHHPGIPVFLKKLSRTLSTTVADMCDNCGAGGKLKRCARCGVARYCGTECQRAAWKEHKNVCGTNKLA